MNTVVVGLQQGDEAKGAVCDRLMEQYDVCVRYSGGPNTGATVVVDGIKYKFHHIPVSILWDKPGIISAGCLVDPERLEKEISDLEALGIKNVRDNLFISPDAHVIKPEHIFQDVQNEIRSGVGSTKRGISPCSGDKYLRRGTKLGTYSNSYSFVDVPSLLRKYKQKNKKVLFEGTQGTLLDIDHGFYPYVSTTSNLASAALVSCGLPLNYIQEVVGVFKPYVTKVGKGPFPTLIKDEKLFDYIVEKGGEYGTTTGRKRMVGYLDLPALKYASDINGCTSLAMMKVDVLEGLDFQYCYAYQNDKETINTLPLHKSAMESYKPLYRTEKFSVDKYVQLVEEFVGVPVKMVSNGPDREQYYWR